jgi:hypothetical protein
VSQLKGDLAETVTALKNEPGSDIGMTDSVSVVRQLLVLYLVYAPTEAPAAIRSAATPASRRP